jgi:cell division septal protein FtsQ
VLSCFAGSGAWFFLISGFWSVADVQTNDLKELNRGEVVSSTYQVLDEGDHGPIDGRTIFFIDEKKLGEELQKRLFVDHVAVEKSYPNVLRLLIEERQRSVVFASKDQLLVIDSNGIVTGEVATAESNAFRQRISGKAVALASDPPLIVCDLPELVASGYQATSLETVRRWLDMSEALYRAGLKFRYLRLMEPKSSTVYVRLEKGYDVIMDLDSDLRAQADMYRSFEASAQKNIQIKEYVDVRVPGKVYLK